MILESRNLESALRTNPCQSSAERSSAFSIVSITRSEHLDIVSASVIRKVLRGSESDERGHPASTHLCLF